MKKFFLLLVGLMCAFCIVAGAEEPESDFEISLVSDKASYSAGDTMTVSVYLENKNTSEQYNLNQMSDRIVFDTNNLEYMSYSNLATKYRVAAGPEGKGVAYFQNLKYIQLSYQHVSPSGTGTTRANKFLVCKLTFNVLNATSTVTLLHSDYSTWTAADNPEGWVTTTKNLVVNDAEYTLNHYKENADGTYSLEESETRRTTTGITEFDDYTSNAKTYTNYTFDGDPTVTLNSDEDTIKSIDYNYDRDSFQLSFDPDDGTDPIVSSVKFGKTITAPTVSRLGYTFDGWDTTVESVMPTQDLSYTAQWIAQSHAVTVSETGFTAKTAVAVVSGVTSDKITSGFPMVFTATPQVGYRVEVTYSYDGVNFTPLLGSSYTYTLPGDKTVQPVTIVVNTVNAIEVFTTIDKVVGLADTYMYSSYCTYNSNKSLILLKCPDGFNGLTFSNDLGEIYATNAYTGYTHCALVDISALSPESSTDNATVTNFLSNYVNGSATANETVDYDYDINLDGKFSLADIQAVYDFSAGVVAWEPTELSLVKADLVRSSFHKVDANDVSAIISAYSH